MQIFAVFAKHNEWYCQEADQKYQICRKCKTLGENCDKVAPKNCKCENLKFDKNDRSCKLESIPKYRVVHLRWSRREWWVPRFCH